MNDIRKEVRELCDIIIKSGEAEFDYSELNDDELSWLVGELYNKMKIRKFGKI